MLKVFSMSYLPKPNHKRGNESPTPGIIDIHMGRLARPLKLVGPNSPHLNLVDKKRAKDF